MQTADSQLIARAGRRCCTDATQFADFPLSMEPATPVLRLSGRYRFQAKPLMWGEEHSDCRAGNIVAQFRFGNELVAGIDLADCFEFKSSVLVKPTFTLRKQVLVQ